MRSFVEKLKEKASCATVQITTEPITLDLSEKMRDDAAHAKPNVAVLIDCFEKFFVGCQIVIVVIPAKVCHIYCHVKQAAELKIGMLTQCVTADSFNPKPNRADSIAGNIVLKINSKLGGINHTVVNPSRTIAFKIFEEPVVIIGADVTHGVSSLLCIFHIFPYHLPSTPHKFFLPLFNVKNDLFWFREVKKKEEATLQLHAVVTEVECHT